MFHSNVKEVNNYSDEYEEYIHKGYIPINSFKSDSDYVMMAYLPAINQSLQLLKKISVDMKKLTDKVVKIESDIFYLKSDISVIKNDVKISKKLIVDEHERNQAVRGINALVKEIQDDNRERNDNRDDEKENNVMFHE